MVSCQRIVWFALSALIRWLVIYPLGSVIWPLNNRGLDGKEADKGHFVDFPGCCFQFFVSMVSLPFCRVKLKGDCVVGLSLITLLVFEEVLVFQFSSTTPFFHVVSSELSLPRCRFQVIASAFSLPSCRFHVVASKLSLSRCLFHVVAWAETWQLNFSNFSKCSHLGITNKVAPFSHNYLMNDIV